MTPDALAAFSSKYSPTTLEAPLRISSKSASLSIGVPRERGYQENRVALTPLAVAQLVGLGHEVLVESKAGIASRHMLITVPRFTDSTLSMSSGATVCN